MPGFIRIIFILGLGAQGCLAAEKPLDAQQTLSRMMKAINELNFEGTIALYKNGKLDTLKFSHSVNDGIRQERLLSLNSPIREVIRDPDSVTCIFPESKKTIIDHHPLQRSFLMDFPKNLQGLEAYYSFVFEGEETIATLPAEIILIEPKDNLRFARKLWVSKGDFLPLKFELLNRTGEMLEQAMFADIVVSKSLPLINYQPAEDYEIVHIHQLEDIPFDQSGFTLHYFPDGFKKIFFTRRPMHGTKQSTQHLILSDGFSSVSVYLEQKDAAMQPVQRTVGAVNSYSRKLGDYQITVMGEVPAVTVRFIADGVVLRDTK